MKQAAHKILHMWRVFVAIFRMSIMMHLTTQLGGVMKFASVFVDMLIYVVFAKIIFSYIPAVGGFSNDQLYMIVGTSMLIEWISWFTFRAGTAQTPDKIQSGKIESVFIRPLPAPFLAFFTRMDIEDVTRAVTGLMLIVPHAAAIASPTALHVALYAIALLGSSAIYYALLASISPLAFFFGKLDGLWAVVNDINNMGRYPFTIFTRKVRWIFFTILPTAFLGSVPTLILTTNDHWQWLALTFAVAGIGIWISVLIWNWAASHYSGASG